jgi:hypothetical protein
MVLHNLGNNKTEIETERFIVFFSYNTPVACNDKQERKFFRTLKKWSVTTSKHVNQWLNGANAESKEQSFFDSLV